MSKQSTGDKTVGGERRATGPQDGPRVKSQATNREPVGVSKSARSAQTPEKRAISSGERRPGSGGSATATGTGSRAGSQARPRTRAMAPQRKGGFSVRPLDLALVGVGLVVVILIVWSSLGNSSSSNGSQNVAQVPGGAAPTQDPNRPNPLPVGVHAPDFTLAASDGKMFTLSQFVGKVVMLELFAPWCPHCQADAPLINQVYDKYNGKGVQVLAVSASPWSHTLEDDQAAQRTPTPISLSDIIWFRDTYGVAFPMLFDKDLNVAQAYGLAYYPTIYIIDKSGNIASMPAGNYVWENGQPVSQPEETLSVDFLSRKIDAVLK